MIFTPIQGSQSEYLEVKLMRLLLNLVNIDCCRYIQVWMSFDEKKWNLARKGKKRWIQSLGTKLQISKSWFGPRYDAWRSHRTYWIKLEDKIWILVEEMIYVEQLSKIEEQSEHFQSYRCVIAPPIRSITHFQESATVCLADRINIIRPHGIFSFFNEKSLWKPS